MPQFYVYCSEEPVAVAGGQIACYSAEGWQTFDHAIETNPFAIADIDPAVAMEYFGAGVFIVGTCWVIGYTCRALLDIIRSL